MVGGRARRLARPGTFGENLTIPSLGPTPRVGDRIRAGGALLEVTAPRIPCAVFANRMDEPAWVKRFAAAERPGAYVRVVEEGEVAPGDPVELVPTTVEHPTLVELMRLWYAKDETGELVERGSRLRSAVERRQAGTYDPRAQRMAGMAPVRADPMPYAVYVDDRDIVWSDAAFGANAIGGSIRARRSSRRAAAERSCDVRQLSAAAASCGAPSPAPTSLLSYVVDLPAETRGPPQAALALWSRSATCPGIASPGQGVTRNSASSF